MYPIALSEKKFKKYKIFVNGKWIHFGDKRYEHYATSDKIPAKLHIYPEHNDEYRRWKYLQRAIKITDRYGNLTYLDKNSPNYWAFHLLW